MLIKLNTIRWQIGNVVRHHLDTLTNGAVKNMTLPIMMVQRQIGLSAQMIFCFSSKTLQSWNLNQSVTQHVSGWFFQNLWFITFFTSFMSVVFVPNLMVILHKIYLFIHSINLVMLLNLVHNHDPVTVLDLSLSLY